MAGGRKRRNLKIFPGAKPSTYSFLAVCLVQFDSELGFKQNELREKEPKAERLMNFGQHEAGGKESWTNSREKM